MTYKKGVSIIICCYNSSSRIEETLKHIAALKFTRNISVELIVVDNASIDDTYAKAALAWKNNDNNVIDFKLVSQPIPGLSNARKKGLETSVYNVVLFCDDDNRLFENYVEVGLSILEKDLSIGILGGLPLPQLEFYPGKWIEQVYPAMAIGPRALNSEYVDWVFGAGMFVRKDIYLIMKERNISLFLTGREKSKQTYGEDVELCILTRLLGYKVYYSDKLKLFHFMQKRRLLKRFFLSDVYIKNESSFYLYMLSNLNTKHEFKDYLIRYVRQNLDQITYSLPRMVFGKYNFSNSVNVLHCIVTFFWVMFEYSKMKNTYKYIMNRLVLNLD